MDIFNHCLEIFKSDKTIKLKRKCIYPHLENYEPLINYLFCNNNINKIEHIIKQVNKFIKSKRNKKQKLDDIIRFVKIDDQLIISVFQFLLIEEFEYDKEDVIEKFELNKNINESKFELRDNQTKAIETAINTNFVSGIHSQATGSGKSIIGLKIMWEYYKRNKKDNIIWLCERKDIPEKLFFKKIKIECENKNKHKIKLEVNHKQNLKWKNNDIIDLNKFNIIEMINNKPKNYHNILNNCFRSKKPYLLIVNRAFFTTKLTKSNEYKYCKIKNTPKFCILDECHSSMSSETYLLLNFMKYNWECKIQGLSATPYRKGKSPTKSLSTLNLKSQNIKNIDYNNTQENVEKLIEIFHKPNNKNQLNILSWFNMKQAIEADVILEPIFHWYESEQINETDTRKKSFNYSLKEVKSILKVLNEISSKCKYIKIIVWCKTVDNANEWHSRFDKHKNDYENIQDIKSFIDHSKINSSVYDETDYDKFYKIKNGILFCACKHREGSDIPNLTIEMFLDKVRNRGSLPLIQHVGRVLRKDKENNQKKNGHVIDSLMLKKNNEQNKIKDLLDKILKYYIELYDISLTDFNGSKSCSNTMSISKVEVYNQIISNLNIDVKNKNVILKLKNNKQLKIDISNINLKEVSWNQLTSKFEVLLKDTMVFSDYEEYVCFKTKIQSLKLKSIEDYNQVRPQVRLKNNRNNEIRFIENPDKIFSHCWENWTIFLGLDTSIYPKNKNDWISLCKYFNISTEKQYHTVRKEDTRLPIYPCDVYEKENFKGIYYELNEVKYKRR